MYIWFDSNGVIREIINDAGIRQGSNNSDKIYVHLDGVEPTDIWWKLRKNSDPPAYTNETSFVNDVVYAEIPYDKDRDMKFFKDFTTYKFFVITLSSSDLAYDGLTLLTVRVVSNGETFAQGLITFNVEQSVIEIDQTITQSQYDYLIQLISTYNSLFALDIASFTVQTQANRSSKVTAKNSNNETIAEFTISETSIALKAFLDGDGNTITSNYAHTITLSSSGGENHIDLIDMNGSSLLANPLVIKSAKYDGSGGEISTRFVSVDYLNDMLRFTRANGTIVPISITNVVKYILNQVGFDATSTATILSSIQNILYNKDLDLGNLTASQIVASNIRADNASFDNVTISGRLISEDVENMLVKDRLIVLNNGLNALGSSQLSGIAIITSGISTATYPKTYNAFGILYNGSASSGDSVQAGFGVVTITQGSNNTENYTFTFSVGQNYPIALRNGLVDGNLAKYDDTTHTLTDSGKAIDDLLYEGKSITATEDQVLGNVNGELQYKTLANPMLYKYVSHPSSDTAGDYLGCFSLHVDENLADGDIFYVTFGIPSVFRAILVVDLDNKTFDLLFNDMNDDFLLVSGRSIIEESDGTYRLNFSYSDLSAYVSYDTLRTYTMSTGIPHIGNGVTIIALDSYIDGQIQDVINKAFLAVDALNSAKVDKVTTIAGVNLHDSITKSELADALGVSPDLNIENGEGQFSLQQVVVDGTNATDGDENYAYGLRNFIAGGHKNKTYQKNSVAIGGGNEAGLSYEEWLNKGNTGSEEDWQNSYGWTFAIGASNQIKGNTAFALGSHNEVYSNWGFAFGSNNKVRAEYATATNGFNNTGAEAAYSFVGGNGSEVYGHKSFAFGENVIVNANAAASFGAYNEGNENNAFEIGRGTEHLRKNIFSVDKYGSTSIAGNLTVTGAAANVRNLNCDKIIYTGTIEQTAEQPNDNYFYNTILRNVSVVNGITIGGVTDPIHGGTGLNPLLLVNGKAKVTSAPVEDNDVLRLKDLNYVDSNFVASSNADQDFFDSLY